MANCRGSRIKCWGVTSWWTLACQPGGSSDDLCHSCHGIRVKLRLGETLGLSAGFTLPSRVKNYVCPYFTSTTGWISNYLSSLGKDGWTWIICSGKFVKKKPSADERLHPEIPANLFLWKYEWERLFIYENQNTLFSGLKYQLIKTICIRVSQRSICKWGTNFGWTPTLRFVGFADLTFKNHHKTASLKGYIMVLYRKVFLRNLLKLTLGGFSRQVSHEPLHCSALLLRDSLSQ